MAFTKIASVPRARTQSNSSDGGNIGGLANISLDNQRMQSRPPMAAGSTKSDRPPEQWEQWKVQDQGVRIILYLLLFK